MRRAERPGFWVRLVAVLIWPLATLLTRRRWSGQEHVPASGGVILVANHVSDVDPLLLAYYVYLSGRIPRFMAKSELWRVPGIRRILRGAGQIPVHRGGGDAQDALSDALAALRAGQALVIYPEGTITRDPDYWPMRGRTGVAWLALTAGVPVVPVAQWGAQNLLGRGGRIRVRPRPDVCIAAGPAVDLSAYADRPLTSAVLREVTDVVMDAVRPMVATLRDAIPPAGVWNPGTGHRELVWTDPERHDVDVPGQAGGADPTTARADGNAGGGPDGDPPPGEGWEPARRPA
jgi:1-acyl-sn-glycerol-3-phosphate acyltransferase